jgi:hypothetical protein
METWLSYEYLAMRKIEDPLVKHIKSAAFNKHMGVIICIVFFELFLLSVSGEKPKVEISGFNL